MIEKALFLEFSLSLDVFISYLFYFCFILFIFIFFNSQSLTSLGLLHFLAWEALA